jgi:Ni/Fe-hydrogenase subunit HybB-like protein
MTSYMDELKTLNHHYKNMWVFPDKEDLAELPSKATTVNGLKLWIVIAAALSVLGVIGFIAKYSMSGFTSYEPWGYYMAAFSFVFMVTAPAPLVAVAFRIIKSHWRRPLTRIAELFAIVGIVNFVLYIPLMLMIPAIANPYPMGHHSLDVRRTLWIQVPWGAPHFWETAAMFALPVVSCLILILSATPDMSAALKNVTGLKKRFYTIIAGRWNGSKKQWLVLQAAIGSLGGIYFLMLPFVQFLIATDLGMSFIAGWKDSIFPAIYTLMGFQTSLAIILIILFIYKRWGGYGNFIGDSPFWSASKILLGLSLLWAYHTFAFFITFWYGRMEVEINIIKYLYSDVYFWVFLLNALGSFIIPVGLLVWNPVRRSAWGAPLAGVFVLFGALMWNIRHFVGAFNAGVEQIYEISITVVPEAAMPDIWDIFMVVGIIGIAALVYLLSLKMFPIMNVWEIKEGAMYQKMGRFIKGNYLVLAKPE